MSELTLLIVIYIYRFIKMSGLRPLLSFTKISGQILHNNYAHNLESNLIVLLGAKNYTIGWHSPAATGFNFFALPKKVNKKR